MGALAGMALREGYGLLWPCGHKLRPMFNWEGGMKRIALLLVAATLAGCAGDVFTTHQMTPDDLRYVSDASLCNSYNFRGFYSGATPNVVNEVRARNLDCNPNKISERVGPVSNKQ